MQLYKLTHPCQSSKLQRAKHRRGDRVQMLLWESKKYWRSFPGAKPHSLLLPGSATKNSSQRRARALFLSHSYSQWKPRWEPRKLPNFIRWPLHHLWQKVRFPLHEKLSEEFVISFRDYWNLKMALPKDGSVENALSTTAQISLPSSNSSHL